MIKKLELTNFRSFSKVSFDLSNKVLIIGNNSLGKTSLLEALNIISITKSHQTKYLTDCIKFNAEISTILAKDEKNNEYKIIINKKGKILFYNKKEIKNTSDYIGYNLVLFFSPFDLNLIKGSPQGRRNFINMQISQVNKKYLSDVNTYNELLKERNILLKQDEINHVLLEVITKQMADLAKLIMQERQKFVDNINKIINLVHNKIEEKENVKIIYNADLNIDHVLEDFNNHLESDIKNKQTDIGIQRDDFLFYLNDNEVFKFASIGQIRSVILSLIISLAIMYKKIYNNYPLLLLDDVFGELDDKRINNLLNIVNNLGQVVISTVNVNNVNQKLLENYQIIDLGV